MKRKAIETAAMLMIGDGVLAAIAPSRHMRLWEMSGPFARMMRWLEARPTLVRAMGVAEAAAGVCVAYRDWKGPATDRSCAR